MRRLRSSAVLTILCALVMAAPAAAKLRAPALSAPANSANVQVSPAFSWGSVKGAVKYEFQLSANSAFTAPVDKSVFQTGNRYATVDKALADGTYYWRVRGIDSKSTAGNWSSSRSFTKAWTDQPSLVSPTMLSTIVYPSQPLVLTWTPVAHAYRYLVTITSDPGLSAPVMSGLPAETSATSFALPTSLIDGNTYYWAVTPEDGEGHRGTRSVVGSFTWSWPSSVSGVRVQDPQSLADTTTVFSPLLSWNSVAGAANYQIEISTSPTFATGSKVCCNDTITGTSFSPPDILPNVSFTAVGFYWRIRAVDIDGNVGPWTKGPDFQEVFDPAVPSIPNLRLTDNTYDSGDVPHVLTAGSTTGTPVIRWDPVVGASSYEVEMAPLEAQGCAYTGAASSETWDVRTATTAFTPLATSKTGGPPPTGSAYTGGIGIDGGKGMVEGHKYCVRVRARSDRDAKNNDVVSDWTQIGTSGTNGTGTFGYHRITDCNDSLDNDGDGLVDTADPGCHTDGNASNSGSYNQFLNNENAPATPNHVNPNTNDYAALPGDYHAVGGVTSMPVFTWNRIPGASAYWVIVARDQALTDVIDESLTNVPAYAPRHGGLSMATYPDQTQSYYWVAMPAFADDGAGTAGSDTEDSPQPFQKDSNGPVQLSPADGSSVNDQPTFRWQPVTGARYYCLQIALDSGFQNTLTQGGFAGSTCSGGIVTDSTAFTSASTLPSGTPVYWRVQGVDELGRGLNFSATRTVERDLPAPTPTPSNPTAGDGIPVLSWTPVTGATSYDIHIDQADGTTRDFHTQSTAFTATGFYGSGIWRWQVRAEFPKATIGETPGPYTAEYSFARRLAPPPNANGVKNGSALLITWDPSPVTIKSYKVQISKTNSFTSTIESATVDGTSWAPKLTGFGYAAGGTLYWRVASVDQGGNVGAYATGTFSLKKSLHVTVSGGARAHKTSKVTVKVTDASGHAVKSARVTGKGARTRLAHKRTSKKGTVTFRFRPRAKGTIVITVTRSGYNTGTARLTVL